MPSVKVVLLGHSYVRDLFSVFDYGIECDCEFRFFFKPGATVRGISMNENFVRSCIEWEPHVVFLLLGGNDIRCDWDIKETFEVYKNFCAKLKERLSNLVLICSTVEPRFAIANDRHRTPSLEQYNVAAKAFNRLLKKWTVPDYRFMTWGANRLENVGLFAKDGVHLNTNGRKIMLRLIYDLVIKVVANMTSDNMQKE